MKEDFSSPAGKFGRDSLSLRAGAEPAPSGRGLPQSPRRCGDSSLGEGTPSVSAQARSQLPRGGSLLAGILVAVWNRRRELPQSPRRRGASSLGEGAFWLVSLLRFGTGGVNSLSLRASAEPAPSGREPFGWFPCCGLEQAAKEKTSRATNQKAPPPGELAAACG